MASTVNARRCSGASRDAAQLFTVMGNETRLRMMQLMCDKEIAVSDLAKALGLSQSATSQHLKKLNDVEIVEKRRKSQMIYYKLASEPVRRILGFIVVDQIIDIESPH